MGNVTTSGSFSGDSTNCTSSCPDEYTSVDKFACSTGTNWNYGTVYFSDPIPPNKGYYLQRINVTIHGSVCGNSTLIVLLGGLYGFEMIV